MVLQYALGYSLMFARGMNDRARSALARADELAERLANLDYQLRSLAGLASICHRLQDFHGAVALGRRAEEVFETSSDPIALSVADWILGVSHQLLGEYAEASAYAQRTYARTAAPAVQRAHIARLGRDGFISAGSTLALIRWVQGLADQAAHTAQKVLVDAEAGDHPISLCLALAWCGCIIPLRLGELQIAETAIARLKDQARRRSLSAYYANGLCFEGQLAFKRGDSATAEQLLRAGLKYLQQTQSETLYTVFLTGLERSTITGVGNGRCAPKEGPEVLCSACRRINDKFPAGIVPFHGGFAPQQVNEIVHLARHQEEAEKSEHPLNRIISVDEEAEGIVIYTPDIHLPRRIGEAAKRAFHGTLQEHFDKGGYFVRIDWRA